jgi:hypothetical protein
VLRVQECANQSGGQRYNADNQSVALDAIELRAD